jgi:hypothetical protein
MYGLCKDVLGCIFEHLELHDLLALRLTCRRFDSILVGGSLLRQRFLDVYGAHSVWESMADLLKSSEPNSMPLFKNFPSRFSTGAPGSVFDDTMRYLDELGDAIKSIPVADRKGPMFKLLEEAISLLGLERINTRDMGSFCSSNMMGDVRSFLAIQDATLLHLAVGLQWEELVLLLLRFGASPNIECHDGDGYGRCTLSWTPLCSAAFLGNARIVRLLLVNGGCAAYRPLDLGDYSKGVDETTLWKIIGGLKRCTVADLAKINNHSTVVSLLSSPIPKWLCLSPYFAPAFEGRFHGCSSGTPIEQTFHVVDCAIPQQHAEDEPRLRLLIDRLQVEAGKVRANKKASFKTLGSPRKKEVQEAQSQTRFCKYCGQDLLVDKFSKTQRKRKGKDAKCRLCVTESTPFPTNDE